jgi:hypothetical protein
VPVITFVGPESVDGDPFSINTHVRINWIAQESFFDEFILIYSIADIVDNYRHQTKSNQDLDVTQSVSNGIIMTISRL